MFLSLSLLFQAKAKENGSPDAENADLDFIQVNPNNRNIHRCSISNDMENNVQ